MRAEATDLIEEGGRVVGRAGATPEGAAGGPRRPGRRGRRAALDGARPGRAAGAGPRRPMDVLWMRLSRLARRPDRPFGRFDRGRSS